MSKESGIIPIGRRVSQKDDPSPPTAYGAGNWVKGTDGMWSTDSVSIRSGKVVGKKYAIKGEKTGEWLVAHVQNTRIKMTPEEIRGCLDQMDYLHDRWPLRVRPELAIGNWDKISGKDSGGFTVRSNTHRGRYWFLRERGMDQANDTIPVGNHVIYINTSPRQMQAHRKELLMTPGFLSPGFDRAKNGFEYATAHEYGHLREWQGLDPAETNKTIMRSLILDQRLSVPSNYGRTSLQEAQAETFAHWVYGGAGEDEFTRQYGIEQGWAEADVEKALGSWWRDL